MIRGLVLAAFCCLSLRAQFNEMVTTDDGSAILFRSPLALRRVERYRAAEDLSLGCEGLQPGLFRAGFAIRQPGLRVRRVPLRGWPDFGLRRLSRLFGSRLHAPSNPHWSLNGATVPAAPTVFPPFQVSRDGRFLAAGSTVVNLSTGAAQTAPGGLAFGGRFGIGNNGGLLMLTLHQFFPLAPRWT